MSRDWTPCEMWNVEKHMSAEGHSMRDANYIFVNMITGEKTPLIPDEQKKIGKNYPMLSFLFEDWYKIYTKMGDEIVRDRTFALYENTLRAVINEEEDLDVVVPSTLFAYDLVKLWYFGKLDPNFYYRERNNEVLADSIWEFYKIETQQ